VYTVTKIEGKQLPDVDATATTITDNKLNNTIENIYCLIDRERIKRS
jgi:hypothetical protein